MQFSLNPLKFEDTRQQIINYLSSKSSFATTFDFTAPNISLFIDAMAYVAMLNSYQVSNVANEMFIDSTSIRKNAVSIAKTVGVRPSRIVSARMNGSITYTDNTVTSDSTITIPINSTFVSSTGNTYYNRTPIILTYLSVGVLSAQFVVYEGVQKTFTQYGTGLPFQSFTIPSANVEENSLNLYVANNSDLTLGTSWIEVKNSFNLISQNCYFIEEDLSLEGCPKIIFGDGTVGNIPANDQVITMNYLISKGPLANNDTLSSLPLSSFISSGVTFNSANITFTSNSSYGGKSFATLADIQNFTPLMFATAGRLVTQNDYNSILSTYTAINKGTAIGGDILYPEDNSKLGYAFISGIPNLNFDLNTPNIYLDSSEELLLGQYLNNYRIISTKVQNVKPSFININLTPYIELSNNVSISEQNNIAQNVKNNIVAFTSSYFNDFNKIFRSGLINANIYQLNSVLSANLQYSYSFYLNKDSFYTDIVDSPNIVYLPLKVAAYDVTGRVSTFTNFVKTNVEQAKLLNYASADDVPISKRTIYGAINGVQNRILYNEDIVLSDGSSEVCNIKIGGNTPLFSTIPNVATANILLTASPSAATTYFYNSNVTGSFDNYNLTKGTDSIGSVIRTNSINTGFKGFISSQSDLLANPVIGDFYECTAEIPSLNVVDLGVKEFLNYVMYNGSEFIPINLKGNISAVDQTDITNYLIQNNNTIYSVTSPIPGNAGGLINTNVEAGDYVIYNSAASGIQKYFKLNQSTKTLDATKTIPLNVTNEQMLLVSLPSTVASVQINSAELINAVDGDLIWYTYNGWEVLINVASSGALNTLTTVAATAIGLLDTYNYSGIAPGTMLLVSGIGDFGVSSILSYASINWVDTNNPIAYDGDILIYTGADGVWNIYSDSSASNILFSDNDSLPITINYGDTFTVSASGTFKDYIFNDSLAYTFNAGDEIVYIGNNSWIPLNSYLSASTLITLASSSAFPNFPGIGDTLYVVKDGNLGNYSNMLPSNDYYVQGDYIVYNGSNWIKLREYSHVLNNSRSTINDLGLNSVMYYKYNAINNTYTFYFDDMFNNVIIGTFRYTLGTDASFDIGKIVFHNYVTGYYDLQTANQATSLQDLFTEKLSTITFLPRNKISNNGLLSNQQETDFDTSFNQWIVVDVNNTVVKDVAV